MLTARLQRETGSTEKNIRPIEALDREIRELEDLLKSDSGQNRTQRDKLEELRNIRREFEEQEGARRDESEVLLHDWNRGLDLPTFFPQKPHNYHNYSGLLIGVRFRSERPRGTSHTYSLSGKPAQTYCSPTEREEAIKWGRWLICSIPDRGYQADRDYAAAANIALLGVTSLTHMQRTNKTHASSMTDTSVKPVSYTGAGAVLLLPPTGFHARPTPLGKVYYPGWTRSAFLQSSHSKETFLRLCG